MSKETLMRAAELLREDADARRVNYGAVDVFVPISQRDAVESRNSVASELERMAQAEPVNQHLLAAMKEARESMQFANDSPCGGMQDTIWMMHRPQTLFDFMDAAIAAAESAQAQQHVVGGSKFFAYDNVAGFYRFDTAEDAKKAAQESIEEWRGEAYDGWPEEIENVCWGVVLGAAKEIRTGDVGDGSGDWYSDYTLADIAQAQEGGAA